MVIGNRNAEVISTVTSDNHDHGRMSARHLYSFDYTRPVSSELVPNPRLEVNLSKKERLRLSVRSSFQKEHNSQAHLLTMKQKKSKKKSTSKQQGHVQLHRSLKVTPSSASSKPMIAMLQDKLKGSKFRWINEQLYTQSGDASLKMIQKDSSLFDVYHQGFREQVTRWPLVPVDVFIKMLQWALWTPFILRKLPRKRVGDFGCGDGKIYKECKNQEVHSFDLVSKEPFIVACDIAHVPLENASLDIAIFCLALMGTNWSEFIAESNRCLCKGGQLWVSVEVLIHV